MIEVDGAVVSSAMTAEDYVAIPEGDRRYWLVGPRARQRSTFVSISGRPRS
jgi:hypothetical protein